MKNYNKALAAFCMFVGAAQAQEKKKDAPIVWPKIASIEIAYNAGDTIHYDIKDGGVGDKFWVLLLSSKDKPGTVKPWIDSSVVGSQEVTIYQYGDNKNIDVKLPDDLADGYYQVWWSYGYGQAIHVLTSRSSK